MIKHLVLFKIKEEYKSEILNTKEIMLSMMGNVEEVKAIQVGIDFMHSERSYDIALEVLLEDDEALNKYQVNPYHQTKVKDLMKKIAEKSITVDYYLE